MTDLVPSPGQPAVDIQLAAFESALLDEMKGLGLPSSGIIVEFEQRRRVFANFENAIADLGPDERGRSVYLSKLLAAVAAGLFDAALNYLWDETISELRRRIVAYDLAYFYDVAVKSPKRRSQLSDADDLARVEDQELIRGARAIGLISDVGYQQLDLIRYMRNYASAAHPNQNDVGAMQLLGWIETCIREVITLPESTVVVETGRLLSNVRTGAIGAHNASLTAEFFGDLTGEQSDNLAAGLFSIYVYDHSTEPARDGVRLLFPLMWPHVSEEQRREFGVRFGRFTANGDASESELSRELLSVVEGDQYLPEQVRVAEIAEAIDDLLVAHRGFNNFHNEPAPARVLAAKVGDSVPDAVLSTYTFALVEVYLTNGHGTARYAEPIYKQLLGSLSPQAAEIVLKSLFTPEISSRLRSPLARVKYQELLETIQPKLARPAARELHQALADFTGDPNEVRLDSALKRALSRLD